MAQLNAQIIPVTEFQQNCTLLFDEETKTGVVVDPGGEAETIKSAAEAAGRAWIVGRGIKQNICRPEQSREIARRQNRQNLGETVAVRVAEENGLVRNRTC